MTTLLISIHEPPNGPPPTEALVSAICPYLNALGVDATLASVRRFRRIKGGALAAGLVNAEFEFTTVARGGLSEFLAKLERFLRKLAKDAGTSAEFSLSILVNEVDDV